MCAQPPRDSFHDLVRNTLAYLKDPLFYKPSFLTSAENDVFFQKERQIVAQKQETPFHSASREKSFFPQPKATARPIYASAKPIQPFVETHCIDSVHSPIKKTLQRIAPHLNLSDHIPDDSQAKRIASGWKELVPDSQVVLLACDASADTLEFLKGLAKAIDQHLAKVKLLMAERLEREKRWDLFLDKNAFRLIIASDGIQKLPELMRFYKSIPANSQSFLDQIPLLVLFSSSVYQSVEQKALLWKTLCHMLKK